MMPNIVGPGQYKRKMINTVVISLMLYAVKIWADALKAESSVQKFASVYGLSEQFLKTLHR